MAYAAFFVSGDVEALPGAFGGFFEGDFHGILQIRALIALLARPAAPAEHLAEYVAEIETLRSAESAAESACPLFEGGMAVLVVHGAFFFVGERVVGFLHVFEFFFGFFVAGLRSGWYFIASLR